MHLINRARAADFKSQHAGHDGRRTVSLHVDTTMYNEGFDMVPKVLATVVLSGGEADDLERWVRDNHSLLNTPYGVEAFATTSVPGGRFLDHPVEARTEFERAIAGWRGI